MGGILIYLLESALNFMTSVVWYDKIFKNEETADFD